MGVLETLLFGSLFVLAVSFVVYSLIKAAVRNGVLEALWIHEAKKVRGELGVGDERTPNNRP